MATSIDTVGRRLQLAMREQREVGMCRQISNQHYDDGRLYLAARYDRNVAHHEGAAYGHAYRAAELAYDLGQAHATGARL